MLISWSTISTKTNFTKFDIVEKIGQGQPRVITHINIVELKYIMLNAKFYDNRTISSVEYF